MRTSHLPGPRAGLALAAGLLIAAFAPTAKADDRPLARYIPKDDLIFYAEFSGLDAHADAWRKTATYRMLNETTAGAMLRDVAVQSLDAIIAVATITAGEDKAPVVEKPTGKQVYAAGERLARSGFAVGLTGKLGVGTPQAVIAYRGAGEGEVGKGLRRFLDLAARSGGKVEIVTREDGRKVTYVKPKSDQKPPTAWWFEGDDLLAAIPGTEAAVDATLETIAGRRPSAVDNPARAELSRTTADGFEPVFISFADLTGIPPTPPALGLAGLKRIDSRWGFQGPALVSVTRVEAPAPRKGLLALIDQPTFEKTDVLPVPAGQKDFSIVSVDGGKVFDQAVAIAKAFDPKAEAAVNQFLDMAKGVLGVSVREELVGQLGPKSAFYIEPEPTTIQLTPYQSFGEWAFHPPKITMVVEVRDAARFARTLDTLMDVANRQIEAQMKDLPRERLIALRPLTGGDKGFVLDVPLGTFPLPSGFRPTLLLGKRYLAVAISPKAARKALAFESAPAAKTPEAIAALPARLMALNVNDPSGYVPEVVANVPFFVQALAMMGAGDPGGPAAVGGLRLRLDPDTMPAADDLRKYIFPGTLSISANDRGVEVVSRDSVPSLNPLAAGPVGVALLLPAVQSARTAARRAQSTNNLKQIMLAMFNFESANGNFPPAAIADAEGKPLLSWRVAVLPYLENAPLYNEFHLDEPWDSPHNKTLIAKMPSVYKSPNVQPADPNSTFYQVLTGGGAIFDSKVKGPKIAEVTDGTSNTIAVVEAGTAVPWTKPDDVVFDPEGDLPKFGGLGFPGGYNVGLADGSVKFLKLSIKPETLRALITRAGGEVISADDY